MATIVIVGAGIGGMPMAYDIKRQLGSQHTVKVVSALDQFQFTPSNPWVGVGWRTAEDISFPLEPALTRKGIEFIHATVTEIKPKENYLVLTDGRRVDY